jgi:hypothetical protein
VQAVRVGVEPCRSTVTPEIREALHFGCLELGLHAARDAPQGAQRKADVAQRSGLEVEAAQQQELMIEQRSLEKQAERRRREGCWVEAVDSGPERRRKAYELEPCWSCVSLVRDPRAVRRHERSDRGGAGTAL